MLRFMSLNDSYVFQRGRATKVQKWPCYRVLWMFHKMMCCLGQLLNNVYQLFLKMADDTSISFPSKEDGKVVTLIYADHGGMSLTRPFCRGDSLQVTLFYI